MIRTLASFTMLLIALFIIVGCGGEQRPDGMPRLYPAAITVMQGGSPLAEASVVLFPEDSANERWAPMGTTDASGVAVLRVDGRYEGAPLGTYKVTVSKLEIIDGPGESRAVQHVPSQYGSLEDSPLRVEIIAGERNYTLEVSRP